MSCVFLIDESYSGSQRYISYTMRLTPFEGKQMSTFNAYIPSTYFIHHRVNIDTPYVSSFYIEFPIPVISSTRDLFKLICQVVIDHFKEFTKFLEKSASCTRNQHLSTNNYCLSIESRFSASLS